MNSSNRIRERSESDLNASSSGVISQPKSVRNSQIKTSKTLRAKKTIYDEIELRNIELTDDIRTTIIREAFKMFDTDNSGEIDKREFRKLIKSLGFEMSTRKIDELMRIIDTNGSGNIDMEEFTQMMMEYHFNRDSPIELHLENTFSLYDKDGDGVISSDDLMKVSVELEELMSLEDANLLINLSKELWELYGKKKELGNLSVFGISKEEFFNLLLQTKFLVEINPEEIEKQKTNTLSESKANQGVAKSESSFVNSNHTRSNNNKSLSKDS